VNAHSGVLSGEQLSGIGIRIGPSGTEALSLSTSWHCRGGRRPIAVRRHNPPSSMAGERADVWVPDSGCLPLAGRRRHGVAESWGLTCIRCLRSRYAFGVGDGPSRFGPVRSFSFRILSHGSSGVAKGTGAGNVAFVSEPCGGVCHSGVRVGGLDLTASGILREGSGAVGSSQCVNHPSPQSLLPFAGVRDR
jgi:hypothetical protein